VGLVRTLGDTAGRVLLTAAVVGPVTTHDGFRAFELAGEQLVGTTFVPGDKLRIHVGGLGLRTYTPIEWDRDRGSTRLLARLPGQGPGSAWCESVVEGAAWRFLGPQRSVRLDRISSPPIFVGDETSFGLVLAWRAHHRGDSPVAALFEVTDADASGAVLAAHGAGGTLLSKHSDGGHPNDLVARVLAAVDAHPGAPLCLTCCAQTIAEVRRGLKDAGAPVGEVVVKAYWDRRRAGLD
jgi:NADPH-dependent ferric siderophore reductase